MVHNCSLQRTWKEIVGWKKDQNTQTYLYIMNTLLTFKLVTGLKDKGQAVPKLYHLDDTVNAWSDFLGPHLHPRSVTVVQEYQHNGKEQPFDTFSQGQNLWSKPTFNDEFTDRIRLYMEDTDNLQVFKNLAYSVL